MKIHTRKRKTRTGELKVPKQRRVDLGMGITVTPTPKETVADVLAEAAKTVAEARLVQRTVSWPKDWWEHFKLRWFPFWALARWPVKFEEKTWMEPEGLLERSGREGVRVAPAGQDAEDRIVGVAVSAAKVGGLVKAELP